MDSAGRRRVDESAAEFAELMSDPAVPVDRLAISLSAVLQPSLEPVAVERALDRLAAGCPSADRGAVVEHLFGPGRIVGDRDRYHVWQNSCIDQVIERRAGIPITLAVVAIGVGRRLDTPLVGVAMPRHFLLGDPTDPEWFADPFSGRHGLDRGDCRDLLASTGMRRWSEAFLDPVPPRLVVARMLNNLKLACGRAGDPVRFGLVMAIRQQMPEFVEEHDEAAAALGVFN